MTEVNKRRATADEWDIVMALVDSLSPALVAEILSTVSEINGTDWVATVADLIENGDYNGVANLLLSPEALDRYRAPFGLAVRGVMEDLGVAIITPLRPIQPPIGPPVEFRFDVLDQRVVQQVQNHSTSLLSDFSRNTRAGVRQHIIDGVRRGVHPREIASALRKDKVIGLSARGAQAVANYRANLLGTDRKAVMAAALQRELRDRRYDTVIQRAMRNNTGLPEAKVDEMVRRYAERMLKHETETIARTEVLQAYEAVKQQIWNDTITRGYLDPKAYVKKWYLAKDERTCTICKTIVALNPNGVPVNGFFKTPNGLPALAGPLAHPNCRCITLITAKQKVLS